MRAPTLEGDLVHRFPFVVLTVVALVVPSALLVSTQPASAGQVCGCQKVTTGRINRITAIPPGVAPTCKAPNFELLCWPDQASLGSVTSITAGDGLQATPTNPITYTGTISVDAPMCSAATDKLLWNGTGFQCGTETPPPSPPDFGAGAHNSTIISVPDISYLPVPFPTKDWDTANILDGTDPTKLVAPIAGRYLVTAAVGFSGNGNGLREVILFVNGVTHPTGFGQQMLPPVVGGEETFLSTSAILDLNTGDYVQVVVAQNSGGPLDLYPSSQVQIQKLN